MLAERLGLLRTMIVTELATGMRIQLMLALPAVAAFLVLPLVGIVLQGTSSVVYGTIGDFVAPDSLPRAFGMVDTTGACCGSVALLAYGLLGDAVGIEYAIAVIGAVVLLSLPLCLVCVRPSHSPTQRVPEGHPGPDRPRRTTHVLVPA